jgi:hypothetical protein
MALVAVAVAVVEVMAPLAEAASAYWVKAQVVTAARLEALDKVVLAVLVVIMGAITPVAHTVAALVKLVLATLVPGRLGRFASYGPAQVAHSHLQMQEVHK